MSVELTWIEQSSDWADQGNTHSGEVLSCVLWTALTCKWDNTVRSQLLGRENTACGKISTQYMFQDTVANVSSISV